MISSPLLERAPTVARLQLLGAPRFIGERGEVIALGPRVAPLVALVALDGAALRTQAAAWLYPHLGSAEARRNLRQLLYKQRALLDALIEHDGERMQLRSGLHVDALAPADSEVLCIERPASLLGSASYDALPQLQAWLEGERGRRLATWRDALGARAAQDERDGRLDEALGVGECLVAEQPTSELAHRRVMRLQYLRGDRAAALEAFDRCERLLKDEVGARPGQETLALLAQIERAELAPARPHRRVPATVLRPPVLIGRDREWRLLDEAWEGGAAIALTGQAGLGKTRLLADFSRANGDDGKRILFVSARPGDEPLPYAVLSRLLRGVLARRQHEIAPGIREELASLLPELGTSSGSRRDPARFVNAIDALIEDAVSAGLEAIILDDLQYADDASLEVAQHLAAESRVRWIVAFRDVELSDTGQGFVATLAKSSLSYTLSLAPLGRDDVHALVASLGVAEVDADTWAHALYRRTGGNPLYLLETIKSLLTQAADDISTAPLMEQLPVAANVGALIERRITRLSATAVRLARCAAVAGQDFSAALASHVLGSEPLDLADGWAELETAQVLRDGAFAHDLIYEAALASVPKPIAAELHARIARFLVDRAAEPARIALHAESGALWVLAASHWQRAGEASERAGRLLEAGRSFASAGRTYTRAGDADQAFYSFRDEAEAVAVHGYDAPAAELLEQLAALAKSPAQRIVALRLHAYHLDRCGEWRRAIAVCQEALGLLQTEVDPVVHLRVVCTMASAYCAIDEADNALSVLRPCELWTRAHGDAQSRMHYAALLGQALDATGRMREAIESFSVSLAIARAEKRPEDIAMLTGAIAISHHGLGDSRRALELARQGAALIAENQGGLRTMSQLQTEVLIATYLAELGEYGEAISLLERAGSEFGAHGAPSRKMHCDLSLALVLVHLGQYARARALLPGSTVPLVGRQNAFLFSVRCELGHAQRASVEGLARQAEALAAAWSPFIEHLTALWRCRLLPPDEALALLDNTIGWALANERRGLALGAHVRASETARAAGLVASSASHARAALALAERHHAPLQYRGDLFLEASKGLEAAGDTSGAANALELGLAALRVAYNHVPPGFRASFVERNSTNVRLLALARRHGEAGVLG